MSLKYTNFRNNFFRSKIIICFGNDTIIVEAQMPFFIDIYEIINTYTIVKQKKQQ